MFPAIALLVTYILLGIPAAVIGLPWALVSGDIGPVYRWAMSIMRIGLRIAGIRVEVRSEQPLEPSGRYIFLSNHISNLDPPVLLPVLPGRVTVFIKRSLTKIPVLGYAMRLASFIPVDRDGRAASAKESVDLAAKVLASGVHVLSFVEGTRSRDGRLQPFKKGPFFLAMESEAPIVPVSIWGTESMMQKGSLRLYPGTAHIVIHAPLYLKDFATREELSSAVRQAIASSLPEWMRGESAI